MTHKITTLIKTSLNKIKNTVLSPAIILLYHRVNNLEKDPQLLAVNQDNFEDQIKYLKENYNIRRLTDLVEFIKTKKIPPYSVVITFDDGYIDNYQYAYPILRKYDVPATLFIATSLIGKKEEFWWDRLEILLSSNTPSLLEVEINGKRYHYNMSDESKRVEAYNNIHKLIKPLPYQSQLNVLDQISKWAGESFFREGYRVLNYTEIQELASSGLIEIGSHTHTHPQLSSLTREAQFYEIKKSKELLESLLRKEVALFSYPFGTKKDYTLDTVQICKEIGFKAACSNFVGQVRFNSDCFQLPRFLVRNWDIDTFERFLKKFFII